MKDLSLVILAAGMGSRYGGLKQLDSVGPAGEVIMEYSIYDAIKAGVNHVVFVIRESFAEDFRATILSRLPKDLKVDLAFQNFSDLPDNAPSHIDPETRRKPWGTGHAVWAARGHVRANFIAINADDYYGPQAFKRLAEHLAESETPNPCMVGFRLANTLSPSGTVSRGVCAVEGAKLEGITERTKLIRQTESTVIDQDSGVTYPDKVLVSMNCWGFGPDFMTYLGQRFLNYLNSLERDDASLQKGEFYLPAAVDDWRAEQNGLVTVLVSEETWLGVTYPEDKKQVVDGLQKRIEEGVYPAALWS